MLLDISINNFKCFEALDLHLSNLNVFSGLNGMGKSTAIQSLLLTQQSYEQDPTLSHIILNGNYVSLGIGKDILFENADNEELVLCYTDEEGKTEVHVDYEADQDVLNCRVNDDIIISSFAVGFEYINAGRLSPKTVYEKSSFYVNNKSQLGIFGQYTAHYLSRHEDDIVEWSDKAGKKCTLKEIVQVWLDEISPNVKLNIKVIENTDLAQLNYYYTDSQVRSNEYRPTNVGFGISYVLPILTALAKAQPNSILIIENPEAHLHPHGQRKLGELIASCAAKGVQIFLETHSDHILNGIRISVKKCIIKADDTRLFFFEKAAHGEKVSHFVSMPQILPNGRLDFWPDGFFDEWEKALDEIV